MASREAPPDALTTISSLISLGGHESDVATAFERSFGGQMGKTHHLTSLLIEQDGLSFLISQFATPEHLAAWRRSPARKGLLDELDSHSLRELCTIDHPVARIVVPSNGSGPKWKMLAASWVVTFPLLILIVLTLDRMVPGAPFLPRIALTSILMSVAITWFISPIVARRTRAWRLKGQQMAITIVDRAVR